MVSCCLKRKKQLVLVWYFKWHRRIELHRAVLLNIDIFPPLSAPQKKQKKKLQNIQSRVLEDSKRAIYMV